jgi:hypothetical protein
MITAVWNGAIALITGNGDPLLTHGALLGGDILATIIVGAGIIFESHRYTPSVNRIATWLVVLGVSLETLFSILLFTYDESISNSQQQKIIALETELTGRPFSKEQYKALGSLRGQYKRLNIMAESDWESQVYSGLIGNAIQNAGIDVRSFVAPPDWKASGIVMIFYPGELSSYDESDPLFKAFTAAGIPPSRGGMSGMTFPAGVPRDVPLIFVGEKNIMRAGAAYFGPTPLPSP